MKSRLLTVLKWFLIILGVIFLIEIILFAALLFGFKGIETKSFNVSKNKELAPIIKYIDKYKNENNEYPKDINSLKLNKNFDFNYELSKDKNCYTLIAKSKKNSSTKQYQECSIKNENSSSYSQVYTYQD